MDLVLKLREIRRMRGLSQKDAAKLSGVGEKTISSFETGQRIGSLKIGQLEKLLKAYGVTPAELFDGTIEHQIAPWEIDSNARAIEQLARDLRALPEPLQGAMLEKFNLILETATQVHQIAGARPAYVADAPEWHMLTSRN